MPHKFTFKDFLNWPVAYSVAVAFLGGALTITISKPLFMMAMLIVSLPMFYSYYQEMRKARKARKAKSK